MRHLARAGAVVLLAGALGTPATAQIGGLKKKVRAAAGVPEAPAAEARAAGGAGGGGTVVVDDEVLDRLVAGLRAGKAEKENAKKSDTPYGRYLRDEAAYAAAKPKCDAGAATFGQRAATDQRIADKNVAFLERMSAAAQKGDTAAQRAWGDSMAALMDPACVVKEPQKSSDFYDSQRQHDGQAEQAELKASGFDRQELGYVKDVVIGVIQDAPPPNVSPEEQAAVNKREAELKGLMGLDPAPAAPAAQAPAAPPPTATAAPPPSGMTPQQEASMDCMARNSQKHEKAIERLGERAAAAAESGNTAAAMAIADSIRQLQMAGCPGS